MKELQWAVVDREGRLYAASNCFTKRDAKERHASDTGVSWEASRKIGDRIARISVSIVKTLPQ